MPDAFPRLLLRGGVHAPCSPVAAPSTTVPVREGSATARHGTRSTRAARLRSHASAVCRPFLLQSRASYTAIGLFSVASYPYSFKLLWSPVVDSVYSLAFGRRKSWVVRRGSCAGVH